MLLFEKSAGWDWGNAGHWAAVEVNFPAELSFLPLSDLTYEVQGFAGIWSVF